MGGRFGKYGDIKRKAALWKSPKVKNRIKNDATPAPSVNAKKEETTLHKIIYHNSICTPALQKPEGFRVKASGGEVVVFYFKPSAT